MRRKKLIHSFADKGLLGFIAEQTGQRPVGKPDRAVLIYVDALRRRFHQRAITGLTIRQFLLDLLALGDLPDRLPVASVGKPGAGKRHEKEEEGGFVEFPGFQAPRVVRNPLIQVKRHGQEGGQQNGQGQPGNVANYLGFSHGGPGAQQIELFQLRTIRG